MRAEIIVDSFAGGGGASLGISMALGHGPDVAINHDKDAIAMHAANHPESRHFTEDVWKVNPRQVTKGRRVGLLWASPDCRHHSRAKGGKPVKKNIRSLAWVVVKWAVEVKPRIICLENVREFELWGPLLPAWCCQACQWRGTEGQAALSRKRRRCPRCDSLRLQETQDQIPDPARQGLTFKRFVGRLRNLGYRVEWRNLNASDFGAPTHRRRLFLVARRDGQPIVWPEPTHGDPKKLDDTPMFGRLKPWHTAAECIDWSLPCPSIFDRKKPLADKTMRRIAMGLKRYVLDAAKPFIVQCNHAGPEFRGQGVDEPMCTLTASRDAHGVVSPLLVGIGGADYAGKPASVEKPASTVMPNDRRALLGATLIQTGYGERPGQAPRAPGLDKPLGTCVNGQKHALVAAMLTKFRGESNGNSVEDPMPTVTSGAGAARPAGAAHALGLTSVFLAKHYGGVVGQEMEQPIGTVTAIDHHSLTAATLVRFNHDDAGLPIGVPTPTVTSNNHFGLVYAFLTKYFATGVGQDLAEPLHTATSKPRFGLVYVEVEPGKHEPAIGLDVPGVGPCVIADIGLRMLTPRELARAQGFPESYLLTGSKANQVAKIGNSVCPIMAKVLVEVNYKAGEKAVAV